MSKWSAPLAAECSGAWPVRAPRQLPPVGLREALSAHEKGRAGQQSLALLAGQAWGEGGQVKIFLAQQCGVRRWIVAAGKVTLQLIICDDKRAAGADRHWCRYNLSRAGTQESPDRVQC